MRDYVKPHIKTQLKTKWKFSISTLYVKCNKNFTMQLQWQYYLQLGNATFLMSNNTMKETHIKL